jgi:hypothetical protein
MRRRWRPRQGTGRRTGNGGQPAGAKAAALGRIRKHMKIKALLEVWLFVHVPVTFALIAALAAHIVSVFFYW